MTLFLFSGQSFAAVKMSCEIPDYSSSMSESTMHAEHVGSRLALEGNHHDQKHVLFTETPVLVKVSLESDCSTNQHSCHCSTGNCTSAFLPASNYFVLGHSVEHHKPDSDFYVSYQPSLLSRPPIFV